jgi:hypothetical protein
MRQQPNAQEHFIARDVVPVGQLVQARAGAQVLFG